MYKILVLTVVALLCSCHSKNDSEKKEEKTITVAASSMPQSDLLKQVQKDLEKEGVTLYIEVMDDYNIPNRALAEKEVDANFFQHKAFLKDQLQQFHYPLCILAEIHIEPMGIYSREKDLASLKEGGVIAIPSDPTNETRALLLLEKAGLITLKKDRKLQATIVDIQDNPKKFRFKEIDAALLTRTLSEVDAATIPTNYALLAGLTPQKDALFMEGDDSSYTNIIVVRCDDMNNTSLLLLKKYMQSEIMRNYILSEYQGEIVPAF